MISPIQLRETSFLLIVQEGKNKQSGKKCRKTFGFEHTLI